MGSSLQIHLDIYIYTQLLCEGKKKDWLGKLEKDKLEIESEAYRKAQEIKGQADAEASKIYAQAYSVDPEFYAFWQVHSIWSTRYADLLLPL